jgi:hypothetical protein
MKCGRSDGGVLMVYSDTPRILWRKWRKFRTYQLIHFTNDNTSYKFIRRFPDKCNNFTPCLALTTKLDVSQRETQHRFLKSDNLLLKRILYGSKRKKSKKYPKEKNQWGVPQFVVFIKYCWNEQFRVVGCSIWEAQSRWEIRNNTCIYSNLKTSRN